MTLQINNQPLISFIIAYYNAGATIQETIESILNQSYPNYDIWIVNDGSTDENSLKKLKEFECLENVNVLYQDNAGPSVARNHAIEKTKAAFFVPLDADDLIQKNALQETVNEIFQNSEVGAVYGDFSWFGSNKGIKKQDDFQLEKQFLMNQIAVTALIRKQMWQEIQGYDTYLSMPGLEDWEFWLRAGLSKWKLKHKDLLFFSVRVNHDSRTYQVANKNLERIKKYVFEKHAVALAQCFESIYYQKKQLLETPDYRIGNFLLKPYRFIKNIFKQ